MLDAILKYWSSAIWSCCNLLFENQQRLCSWTACLFHSAAPNWMPQLESRICNFVSSTQSLDNQFLLSRSSKPMLVISLCNSFARLLSKFHFHEVKSRSKIHCYDGAVLSTMQLKLFWFSNNFTLARLGPTDSHIFRVSSLLLPALAVPNSQSTCLLQCPSDPRRTFCLWICFDFTLALDMNLDTWPSSWFRSRFAAVLALECRPPDHLRKPKLGRSEINLQLVLKFIENRARLSAISRPSFGPRQADSWTFPCAC